MLKKRLPSLLVNIYLYITTCSVVIRVFWFIPTTRGESQDAPAHGPCSNSCCLKQVTQNTRLHPNQRTCLKGSGVQKTDRAAESSGGDGYASDTLKWAGPILRSSADTGG